MPKRGEEIVDRLRWASECAFSSLFLIFVFMYFVYYVLLFGG
jgi:hypothetical protein